MVLCLGYSCSPKTSSPSAGVAGRGGSHVLYLKRDAVDFSPWFQLPSRAPAVGPAATEDAQFNAPSSMPSRPVERRGAKSQKRKEPATVVKGKKSRSARSATARSARSSIRTPDSAVKKMLHETQLSLSGVDFRRGKHREHFFGGATLRFCVETLRYDDEFRNALINAAVNSSTDVASLGLDSNTSATEATSAECRDEKLEG